MQRGGFVDDHVPTDVIRIFSDIHYGDRASGVRKLAQIRPLLDGPSGVIFNGDTLDTRPGPRPEHTAECRAEVEAFARTSGAPITFLTGNHDPDFSNLHLAELAAGRVLATHGDIFFDNIVPWGRDAQAITQQIRAALGAASSRHQLSLPEQLCLWRRVAAAIPQRHQSERNPVKYAARFAADTVWPPLRFFHVLRAWRTESRHAADLARRYHPQARFVITGHTHLPAVRRVDDRIVTINTGSFCPPLGAYAVDVGNDELRVRKIETRNGEYRVGSVVAEFPLAHD